MEAKVVLTISNEELDDLDGEGEKVLGVVIEKWLEANRPTPEFVARLVEEGYISEALASKLDQLLENGYEATADWE